MADGFFLDLNTLRDCCCCCYCDFDWALIGCLLDVDARCECFEDILRE
jgi:hypothetical protein